MLINANILCACTHTGIKAEDYANQTPSLTIQHYFNGKISAYSLLQDKNKKTTRRFVSHIIGKKQQDNLVFIESSNDTNNYKHNRVWCFHMVDEHHFAGLGSDISGVIQGEQFGNVIHMQYKIPVPTYLVKESFDMRNEFISRIQTSIAQNIYSLLRAGGPLSQIKSLNKLQKENINPYFKNISKTKLNRDAGNFCRNVVMHMTIQKNKMNYSDLDADEWLFNINNKVVLGRTAITKRGYFVGELFTSYQKN